MKSKSKSQAVPKVDPYLEGLMGKLLDRLVSLENKMDMVISQTARNVSVNREGTRPAHANDNQHHGRHDRVFYEAVCADCSKACKIPFRPTQDRAVYCKECFALRKSGPPNVVNKPVMPAPTPVDVPTAPAAKPAVVKSKPSVRKAPAKTKKSTAVKKKKQGKKG